MSFHLALRRALAVALPLLLAACASLNPPAADHRRTQSTAEVRNFADTIDLGGRLSVRYQSERKEEALHGSFSWAQTPAQTTVTLLSPLGQTIAIIDVTPQGATLMQGGQPARSAADVDTLTAETLGWPLPVAGLRDWLQGFAVDAAGLPFVATPRSPDVVTRDGWHIRYAGWQGEADASPPNRPRRIDLARATEQAGDVSIRIVIDSWQAH